MTMLHCNDRVTSKICLTGFEKWHVELCRLVDDRKSGTDLLHVQLLLCLNLKELFYIVFFYNSIFKQYSKCLKLYLNRETILREIKESLLLF